MESRTYLVLLAFLVSELHPEGQSSCQPINETVTLVNNGLQGCPAFWRLWATLAEEELSWVAHFIHKP